MWIKAELDKILEARDQTLNLYNNMEAKRAQFAAKENECKDRLNKMGIELNASLDNELRLGEEIKALEIWEKEASQRSDVEKKKAEEEKARAEVEKAKIDEERSHFVEALKKVEEANRRPKEALRRAAEAEEKAIKAVEIWRESSKFDVLVQDAYVWALEEIVKYIHRKRT